MEYGLVALWLVLYLALLAAGTAITSHLFPRFADRGAGVAIPVSITVLWFVTYFVGRASLTAGVWLGVVVLLALVGVAWYRGVDYPTRRVAETGAVFSAAFLFLVWVRVFAVPLSPTDPVVAPLPLAIGEKMLDFGLLKAILRADTLPPEDMWFAGESVAYYYGGHLVAAILTTLTGTAPRFGYNLALAGFYATLVTAVYGVAGSVAADREIPRRLAGAASAFAVGIASNLSTPGRYLLGVLPEDLSASVASALEIERDNLATGPENFWYFDASRVITDERGDFAFQFETAGESPTINEFPFFAWFNADLHAHMMSTGFLVLAVALCFAYYQTPADRTRRRRALLLAALPPVAGLLAVTNTWSFLTPAGLAFLAVALAPADARTLAPAAVANRLPDSPLGKEASRLTVAVGVAAGVALLGVLWSLPFWFGAASGREFAVLPDRSSLAELLLVHGLFVVVFAAYLYGRFREYVGADARINALVVVLAALTLALADLAALGLFVLFVAFGWYLLRNDAVTPHLGFVPTPDGGERTSPVGFETVLVVAGIGLVTLVEFAYLKEGTGRMNTVFKVYMQVWVLWSVAFGPALAWLLTRRVSETDRTRNLAAAATRVGLAVLVASSGLYAPLAISTYYDGEDPTLDGLAYLDEEYPNEGQAIQWLDERDGTPTIVTGVPAAYNWRPAEGDGSAAPASLTGLPTVLGWVHERQYRNDTVYEERFADVGTIYTGDPDEQAELLRQYDVEYVYVGPAERNNYGSITVNQVRGVEQAQRWDDVVVYRVSQDDLPE